MLFRGREGREGWKEELGRKEGRKKGKKDIQIER